jgi:hypothetical protein
MRFAVVATRRRGVLIFRRELACEVAIVGDLQIVEEEDAQLARRVMRAHLFAISGDGLARYLLPPLTDPRLLWMGVQGMTLAGIERVGDIEYAQCWWCRGC